MAPSARVAARPAPESAAAPVQPSIPLVLPEKMGEAVELMASLWLGPRAASEEDHSQRVGEALDRSAHYLASRITHGLSPMAVAEAFFDWMIHLSASPGKQLPLAEKAARKSARACEAAKGA